MSKWATRLYPRSLRITVTTPRLPKVAIQMNASGAPAKYAKTREALETRRRSRPLGLPATTAAAIASPARAGPSEAHRERIRLFSSGLRYCDWLKIALKFDHVRWFGVPGPLLVVSAPWMTSYSGAPRNTATYSRNGSIPRY